MRSGGSESSWRESASAIWTATRPGPSSSLDPRSESSPICVQNCCARWRPGGTVRRSCFQEASICFFECAGPRPRAPGRAGGPAMASKRCSTGRSSAPLCSSSYRKSCPAAAAADASCKRSWSAPSTGAACRTSHVSCRRPRRSGSRRSSTARCDSHPIPRPWRQLCGSPFRVGIRAEPWSRGC